MLVKDAESWATPIPTHTESLRVRWGICPYWKPPTHHYSHESLRKVQVWESTVIGKTLQMSESPLVLSVGNGCRHLSEAIHCAEASTLCECPTCFRDCGEESEFHIQLIYFSFHVAQSWPTDGVHWMWSFCQPPCDAKGTEAFYFWLNVAKMNIVL